MTAWKNWLKLETEIPLNVLSQQEPEQSPENLFFFPY